MHGLCGGARSHTMTGRERNITCGEKLLSSATTQNSAHQKSILWNVRRPRRRAVRHILGRPSFSKPGRLEKKGANITRPRDQETTNRYNDVQDLVFRSVIWFGSEGYPGPAAVTGAVHARILKAQTLRLRASPPPPAGYGVPPQGSCLRRSPTTSSILGHTTVQMQPA